MEARADLKNERFVFLVSLQLVSVEQMTYQPERTDNINRPAVALFPNEVAFRISCSLHQEISNVL